jgi:FkbM family methyltransferase
MRCVASIIYRVLPKTGWIQKIAEKINVGLMSAGSGHVVVVERQGVTYELDLSQLIDARIYYEGEFEPETAELFRRLVRPGMVVFDIGANVGAHALPLAKMVGVEGHVYMFEPTQWAFAKLQHNLSLNPELKHVTLENMALSDHDATEESYSIRSQWSVEGEKGVLEEGNIEFATLDSYCNDHGIEGVDFIKLDVDGFETKILRGGQAMLDRMRPILLVEMSDYWQRQGGESARAMIDILDQAGYRYLDEETLEPIEGIVQRLESLEGDTTINVVCVAGQK